VSCTSASNCTAVGDDWTCDCQYGLFETNQPIYESDVAGTWGAITEMSAPTGSLFNAVSCPSADSCVAVGDESGSSHFSATESSGTWAPPQSVSIPGYGTLAGIDCISLTSCNAVGGGTNSAFSRTGATVHLVMAAGTWGKALMSGGGSLSGISCTSTTTCGAVGAYDVCDLELCTNPGDFAITASEHGAWTGAPGAPTLRRAQTSSRSVKVSWAAPSRGRSAVTGYVAVAEHTVKSSVSDYECSTVLTACTIHGLANGRTYTISVVARSAVGASVTSTTLRETPH
jgi:hypothetical protein